MKVQSGIYTISEGPTVLYVGGASHVRERIGNHQHRLRAGTHPSAILREAYARLGCEGMVFQKVIICAKKDLKLYEQRALDAWKPQGNTCPIAGSPLGMKQTEETKEKKRQALKGRAPTPAVQEAWRRWNASRQKED